jgi:hypothetical protein
MGTKANLDCAVLQTHESFRQMQVVLVVVVLLLLQSTFCGHA